ncbi:MAG: PKD domain-containing protein, partial [Saprospiraceae bacterium]
SVVSTQTVVVDCICPIPVANFTYVVNCSGNTNSVNFTSISTGQGLTYLWDFGDGSTFNGQSPPPHQYTNNGSYTVSLTVRDECGQITFVVKKVNVLCSGIGMIECGRKIYENAYLLDASNGDLNFAQYAVQNNVPYTVSLHWGFTNLTFVVRGNVIMDRNLSFNNCTFVFDAGASLTLNNTSKSQSIHFLFSKLYACGDVMWKGVKSLNGSHYFTSGTEIRDAEYGIEVLNGGALTTLNTTFSQNGVGIMFRSNASHRIEGCTFIGDRDKPLLSMYSGQENYKGKSYAGVFFDEIASGNVGRENSTNKNIFRYLMVPIVAFNTNINIHNNEMYEMFVANCDPNIRDKWNACSDIWIFSGAKHKISENIIKTPHRIGILVTDMLDGTMDVTKNKAEELGTFFKSQYNSQNTFNIYNNNESSFQNGGIACYFGIEQGAYGSGENIFNIYNNKFNSNTINPNTYSSIHIYNEGNDLTSSVYYNVFDITKIQFNPAQPTTFSPIVFLADFNFVNFYENTFNSYATNKHYQVHLQLVKKIFASDNKLNNLSPDPSNVQNGFRVFGGNIDSKFYCNQITSANIGSYFYGDFPIIDFSSNLMKNNDIGINVFRLFQGQTNKGNLWVGSNSLANHENGGSFRWSVNPNQPPPAIEPNGMFRPTTVNPPFWFLSVPEFANHCFGPELMGNEETPEAKANLIINSLADENVDGALQRWELQKQLLELFLDFPHLLNANDIYAEALAQIPSDVYLYHNALNEYYEILQLNSEEHTALNNVRNLLNNKVIDKEELWTIIENNAEGNEDDFHSAYQLATELDLLKEQELQILSDIKQRQMNEMYQFNSEVNNLPETQYFHKEMKDMLSIKSELFYYGLEYIKTNHLEYLRNIASKCFIEYGKPVSDAIEILRLNDEQHNMNLDNCTMVENRSKNLKAESEENLIYPNPASSRIYVSQSFSSISHLLIESLEGSLSKMCEYKDDGVDVANLPAGVYLVHLMDNGSMIKTTKFIKIN